MTQFCIQGASTLKKSNEKRMATSFPESSVYQSKSFAKLQSATRKPFHYDSKHLFLQAYMGWFFVLHLFAFCFLCKYSLTAFYKMSLNYQCRTCWVWFLHDPYSSYFSSFHLRPIWSRNHAHTSQLLGGTLWKIKWDQFKTLTLLKSHSSVFLSHVCYNDVLCRIFIVENM